MKRLRHIIKSPNSLLIAILLISFIMRLYNLNYNSPFLDEAQYIVLGQKVLAGHWQEADPFSWVGGMPLLYPPVVAIFGIFGIVGARFLNVIFGTVSVYLLYEFTKNLQLSKKEETNESIGLIAASLLGILAIPLYLSRLAIYDLPSFTFFLVGLVLLQKALLLQQPKLWQRENRFFFSSLFFLLSLLTKYTTFIFFPFILLWAFYTSRKQGKEALKQYIKYFAGILIAGTLLYFGWRFDALLHFLSEQVGAAQNQSPQIITQFAQYSLPILILAILALPLIMLRKGRQTLLPIMLLLGALIVPIVHLITNNVKAIDQQTFLSLIFLLPLAAYFFTFLLERAKVIGGFIVAVVFIGLFITSQVQLQKLQKSWSNTESIMNYLKSNTTNHEKLLSFEDDISILALPHLKEENIVGIYTYTYKDVSDKNAYNKALKDGYFDLILFNDERKVDISSTVKNSLTNHYNEVYKEDHHFIVYKLRKGTE